MQGEPLHSPDRVDSDSDGTPDFEEVAGSGFIVGVDDRYVDTDGDHYSNAEEYVAGTNPLSASSFFEIKEVSQAGPNLTIRLPSQFDGPSI